MEQEYGSVCVSAQVRERRGGEVGRQEEGKREGVQKEEGEEERVERRER